MSILKIAVQKKGRLSAKSIELLKECGLKFNENSGSLKTVSTNFPVEILFLRDDDIPKYVAQQIADIGILGENEVLEKRENASVVKRLGFAACRLCLAIPKAETYPGIEYFQNKTIATSYPNILQQFFDEKGISADIESISGSVEIAPNIGLADGIFDIVSSGSTLEINGLKEVETVKKIEAVLISSPKLNSEKQAILDKLLFRISAVLASQENKYILMNAPNDKLEQIISVLPGIKSPTILPLAESGWSSVHTVIQEDRFWEIIDLLKENGAQGILVIPIEKMII